MNSKIFINCHSEMGGIKMPSYQKKSRYSNSLCHNQNVYSPRSGHMWECEVNSPMIARVVMADVFMVWVLRSNWVSEWLWPSEQQVSGHGLWPTDTRTQRHGLCYIHYLSQSLLLLPQSLIEIKVKLFAHSIKTRQRKTEEITTGQLLRCCSTVHRH